MERHYSVTRTYFVNTQQDDMSERCPRGVESFYPDPDLRGLAPELLCHPRALLKSQLLQKLFICVAKTRGMSRVILWYYLSQMLLCSP